MRIFTNIMLLVIITVGACGIALCVKGALDERTLVHGLLFTALAGCVVALMTLGITVLRDLRT